MMIHDPWMRSWGHHEKPTQVYERRQYENRHTGSWDLGLKLNPFEGGLKYRIEQWRNSHGVLRKALLIGAWTLEFLFYAVIWACILAVVTAFAMVLAAGYILLHLAFGALLGDL